MVAATRIAAVAAASERDRYMAPPSSRLYRPIPAKALDPFVALAVEWFNESKWKARRCDRRVNAVAEICFVWSCYHFATQLDGPAKIRQKLVSAASVP